MLASIRSTNILLIVLLAVGVAIVAMLATGVRGGPLDPPGPPGSTDGVRLNGTPISSLPYAITERGHYYLTRNFSVNGAVIAIDIQSSDVSLDLGGFTILGNNSFPSYGIYLGSAQNIEVTHGSIQGFQFGIQAGVSLPHFSGHLDCWRRATEKGVQDGYAIPGRVPRAGGGVSTAA